MAKLVTAGAMLQCPLVQHHVLWLSLIHRDQNVVIC